MTAVTVPLVGEPLALDLINTRFRRPDGVEVDLLETREAFDAWLALERERLGVGDRGVDLRQVRRLREHVAVAVDHARVDKAPPASALQAMTDVQRGATGYRELRWDPQERRVFATQRRTGSPIEALLGVIADEAIDLLVNPSVRKIRRCDGPGCRLMFLPAHPGRRWCSPSLCGNRVRVARYYQRHKDPRQASC